MEGAFVPSVFFSASSVSVDTNTDFASWDNSQTLERSSYDKQMITG